MVPNRKKRDYHFSVEMGRLTVILKLRNHDLVLGKAGIEKKSSQHHRTSLDSIHSSAQKSYGCLCLDTHSTIAKEVAGGISPDGSIFPPASGGS